jgi:hypothetical protein
MCDTHKMDFCVRDTKIGQAVTSYIPFRTLLELLLLSYHPNFLKPRTLTGGQAAKPN